MTEIKRTSQQNKALHKFCTEVAEELNASGLSVEVFYRHIEADHTMETVKNLWRAIGKAKYGKEHTSEFTTKEFVNVCEEVSRHLGTFGIDMDFPSQDEMERYKNYENERVRGNY